MVTFYCRSCEKTITVPESTVICPFCSEELVPDLYVTSIIKVNGKIEDRNRSGTSSDDRTRNIR